MCLLSKTCVMSTGVAGFSVSSEGHILANRTCQGFCVNKATACSESVNKEINQTAKRKLLPYISQVLSTGVM